MNAEKNIHKTETQAMRTNKTFMLRLFFISAFLFVTLCSYGQLYPLGWKHIKQRQEIGPGFYYPKHDVYQLTNEIYIGGELVYDWPADSLIVPYFWKKKYLVIRLDPLRPGVPSPTMVGFGRVLVISLKKPYKKYYANLEFAFIEEIKQIDLNKKSILVIKVVSGERKNYTLEYLGHSD